MEVVHLFRSKFAVPFLTNRFFALIREFGNDKKWQELFLLVGARFNQKMSFHFPWVVPLISDPSVWHNGKQPRCPTRITANKAIDIFMNYPLVPLGRQQERHKFAYLIMKNNSFARSARAFFIFWTFHRPSRSFHDMKWVVLQLCGRREHLMTNVPLCLPTSKALHGQFQFIAGHLEHILPAYSIGFK